MRWKGRRQSSNVEDRRGEAVPRGSFGGGKSMGIAGGMGVAKIFFTLFRKTSGKTRIALIVVAVIGFLLFKGNLLPSLLNSFSSGGATTEQSTGQLGKDDEHAAFIGAMLGANEDIWKELFPKAYQGQRYQPAQLTIYSKGTRMGDGSIADANMGPFYLPAEKKIYLDPSFFTEMETQFGVKGEFARAYIIAHEFGHHLQNLLGLTTRLHSQHGKISKIKYNQESVRLELHADFLAGVFAHHDDKHYDSLDQSDIRVAIKCAQAIGDDRLQKNAGRKVQPDHFTHGTSEQRAKWFMAGYNSGNPRDGDQLYQLNYDSL